MEDIIAAINESAGKVQVARRSHAAVMAEAEQFLKPLWEEYSRLFRELGERAADAGIEWNEYVPGGDYESWGNAGLVSIGPDPSFPPDSGMMRITTGDCFRGERDEREASMPRRFMGSNGLELIRSEAAHLGQALNAAIATKEEEERVAREEAELAEYQRLSGIYGSGPT